MNSLDNPFHSFCSFILDESLGAAMCDITYRAYDLDRLTGENTMNKAIARLGRNSASELADDLRCIGLLPEDGVRGAACRWYVWYRLCRGDIAKWPLRTPAKTVPAVAG